MTGCLDLIVLVRPAEAVLQLLDRPGARGPNDAGCLGLALCGLLSIGASLRRRVDRGRTQRARLELVRVAAQRHQAWVANVHDAQGARAAGKVPTNQRHPGIARAVMQYGHPGDCASGLQRERRGRRLSDVPANEAGTPMQRGAAAARRAIPARLRFAVLQRDAFRCRYCGRTANEPGVVLHVDHVVPVAAGGTNYEGNLVTACAECNLGKSTRALVSAGS